MSVAQIVEPARVRRIETPEGVRLPFEVARAGDRIVAFVLDFVLIHVLVLLLTLTGVLAGLGGSSIALSFAIVSSFFLRNFYFVYMELSRGGMTFGKRRLGLRVIARDGGPLTAEAVFARNLTRDLEVFLPLGALLQPQALVGSAPGWGLLLAILWLLVLALFPLLNRDRLRIGDSVGGTMVVKAPRAVLLSDLAQAEIAPSVWETPEQASGKYTFTGEQLDLYGIHELQVLENVLRDSVGYRHRELVERVCEKIKQKILWPKDDRDVDPDQFLLAFYKAQRARLEQRMLFGERRERKKS